MLALARTFALGRLAAAVLALALSGAPGIASLHAPEREHRCTCPTGRGHVCACPRCHAAAAARRAAEERSPPCHAVTQGTPAPAPSPRPHPAAPCWTGSCGTPEAATASPLALEVFTVPGASRLSPPRPTGDVAPGGGRGRELPSSPETPPPRAA